MQNTPKLGQKLAVIRGFREIGQTVVEIILEQGLEVTIFELKKSIHLIPPQKAPPKTHSEPTKSSLFSCPKSGHLLQWVHARFV